MERHVAIKKLTKLLGKNLGYRVDPKAADQDDRAEARIKLRAARETQTELREQLRQRCNAVLAADEEYQRLKAALTEATKTCDELVCVASHYRFTAGIINHGFFVVSAQGDSWEEVIAKLEKERVS